MKFTQPGVQCKDCRNWIEREQATLVYTRDSGEIEYWQCHVCRVILRLEG